MFPLRLGKTVLGVVKSRDFAVRHTWVPIPALAAWVWASVIHCYITKCPNVWLLKTTNIYYLTVLWVRDVQAASCVVLDGGLSWCCYQDNIRGCRPSPGSPAAGPMTKFTHWSLCTGLPHPQAAGFPQGERSQKTREHPEWKLQSYIRLSIRSNFCYFYPTLVIRSEAVNPAHAQILGDYTRMVNVRRRGRLGQLRGPAMGFPGGSMV